MAVELRPAKLAAIQYISERMRERDREEIFATRFDDDPLALADDVALVPHFCWTAHKDDEAVAVIGARPMWPNVWTVFAYGTDRWPEVVLTLTKHVRRFMEPALVSHGVHTAVCWSHRLHTDAHGWLKLLGLREEASIPCFGKRGEDFAMFVWRRPGRVLQ